MCLPWHLAAGHVSKFYRRELTLSWTHLRLRGMPRLRSRWYHRSTCPRRPSWGWRCAAGARTRPPPRTSCTFALGIFPESNRYDSNDFNHSFDLKDSAHISLPAPLGLAVGLAEAAGEDGLLVLALLHRQVLQRLDPLLHFLEMGRKREKTGVRNVSYWGAEKNHWCFELQLSYGLCFQKNLNYLIEHNFASWGKPSWSSNVAINV